MPDESDPVGLNQKLRFLASTAPYGPHAGEPEVRETHMSWVFLTIDRVYKLKKPVRYQFLDFSTLAARKSDCLDEVRLNRRLAPQVYLGIVPLVLKKGGKLSLGGQGKPVDWLVEMQRLPDDRMLDRAIALGWADRHHILEVADLLTRFYQNQEPVVGTANDYVLYFADELRKNRDVLEMERFALPKLTLQNVLDCLDAIICQEPDLLGDRARNGTIVEGHGDLRPEHVCLIDPPVIIDCLEFNRSFRLVDPFDELAYLGMECKFLGADWIGDLLIQNYSVQIGYSPPDRLLAFYITYRACLRARLAISHLLEVDARDPDRWVPLALTYLQIAERTCLKLHPQGAR